MTVWDKYEKDNGQEFNSTILSGKETIKHLFAAGSITENKAKELNGRIKTYYFPSAEAKETFEIGVKVGDIHNETVIIGSKKELSLIFDEIEDID
jgi:hypothetical protein